MGILDQIVYLLEGILAANVASLLLVIWSLWRAPKPESV